MQIQPHSRKTTKSRFLPQQPKSEAIEMKKSEIVDQGRSQSLSCLNFFFAVDLLK